jgi:hypothetical protein
MTEFLVDNTPPVSTVGTPAASDETDNDQLVLVGNAVDQVPPGGPGVNVSSLPARASPSWNKHIELQVLRNEPPGSKHSVATIDDYFWDGSTWTHTADTWFSPADFNPVVNGSQWTDNSIRCDVGDGARCWQRGRWYWIKTRARDYAGNQGAETSARSFLVSADVDHFAVMTDTGPYIAGSPRSIRVEAHDETCQLASNFNGSVKFQSDSDAPEIAGDGLPGDTPLASGIADPVSGLTFRRAGSRALRVEKTAGADPQRIRADHLIGYIGVIPSVAVTTAPASRVLVLAQGQSLKPGCNSVTPNCPTILGRTADSTAEATLSNVAYTVRVLAVDQYFNPVGVSSQPYINLVSDDPRTNMAAFQNMRVDNGDKTAAPVPISKGVTHVSAQGAGTAGAYNITPNMTVRANDAASVANRKLLLLLPGEALDSTRATARRPARRPAPPSIRSPAPPSP